MPVDVITNRKDITSIDTSATNVTNELLFNVQLGLIAGVTHERKYGENIDVDPSTDPEYIRDGGGSVYPYASTNTNIYVYSDDALDVGGVTIYGLKEDVNGDWNFHQVEVFLNGNTPVLAGQFIRVFRVRNIIGECPSGNTYVSPNSVGLPIQTETWAILELGRGSTMMAMYTVPSGYTAFVYKVFSASGRNDETVFSFEIRPFSCSVFFTSGRWGRYGESAQLDLGFEKVSEKSDIRLMVETESINARVEGSFHFLLVRNEYIK